MARLALGRRRGRRGRGRRCRFGPLPTRARAPGRCRSLRRVKASRNGCSGAPCRRRRDGDFPSRVRCSLEPGGPLGPRRSPSSPRSSRRIGPGHPRRRIRHRTAGRSRRSERTGPCLRDGRARQTRSVRRALAPFVSVVLGPTGLTRSPDGPRGVQSAGDVAGEWGHGERQGVAWASPNKALGVVSRAAPQGCNGSNVPRSARRSGLPRQRGARIRSACRVRRVRFQ
jgi:hypothetical protein